jgi:hypothetical protein
MRVFALSFVLACAVALQAADAMADFRAAMGGTDWTNKKSAISAIAALPKERDDEVYPALIGALSDRQAKDAVIAALRSRTGLTPSPKKGAGGYPAYPPDDSAGSWNAWLTARTAEMKKKKELEELSAKVAEAEKKAKEEKDKEDGKSEKGEKGEKGDGNVDPTATDEASDTPKEQPKPQAPTDLGRLDRIVFKSGSSLLCYLINRRLDADGNLISVRVAHTDGGGEEVLAADLISRIDEDVE